MYTIEQYTEAIERELKLRARVNPKRQQNEARNTFDAAVKSGYTIQQAQDIYERHLKELCIISDGEFEALQRALDVLHGKSFPKNDMKVIFQELERERNMREKMYPFFVVKRIMTANTAQYEQLVWNALCTFFKARYNV